MGEGVKGVGKTFGRILKGFIWVVQLLLGIIRRNFFIIVLLTTLVGSFLAGTVFESTIRRFYPEFSGEVLLSSVIFLYGVIYALMERNFLIGVIAIVGSCTVPLVHRYLVLFWPIFIKKFLEG